MGIELRAAQQRMTKKLKQYDHRLAELTKTICPIDGVPQNEQGRCPVCSTVITPPDPIPAGVQIPVDDEKAERLRAFYARAVREKAEREQTTPTSKKQDETSTRRDWRRVLTSEGRVRS